MFQFDDPTVLYIYEPF